MRNWYGSEPVRMDTYSNRTYTYDNVVADGEPESLAGRHFRLPHISRYCITIGGSHGTYLAECPGVANWADAFKFTNHVSAFAAVTTWRHRAFINVRFTIASCN